jgi:hypothetical protein
MAERLVVNGTGTTANIATAGQVKIDVTSANTAQARTGTATDLVMTPASTAAVLPFVIVHPSGDTTGTTDTAAINAATNNTTPKQVRLAAGTFYVNAVINLRSNTSLQGAGRDATTILLVAATTIDAVINYASGGQTNVEVADLTIDANRAGSAAAECVRLATATNPAVRRCRLINAATRGIFIYQGSNAVIEDNEVDNIGAADTEDGSHAAILAQETDGATITRNRVTGCSDTAILAPTVGHTVISDNVIDGCYFIGIGLGGGHTATDGNYTISGNTLRNVEGNPIDTGDACNFTVTGNSMSDSATGSSNVTAGICIDISGAAAGILNGTIVGNTLQNISKCGIQIVGHQTSGHSQITIANNSMTGLGQHGIQLAAFDYATIVGNTIRNCGTNFAFVHLTEGTGSHGCSNNVIVGNLFDDSDGNSYGIHSTHATNDYNVIADNNMRNCAAKAVGTFGPNCGDAILGVALSDETTTITTGTGKATVRAPYAFALIGVRASVNTVSSSGVVTVDVNDGGTTVLSTKLTIDASEKTSTTAATAAVLSDMAVASDAELTFDIDTAGTGAKGLKVWLYGFRT